MELGIEVSHSYSPQFPTALLRKNCCRLEIEVRCPFKGKSALTDVALVLEGIEFDLHSLLYIQFKEKARHSALSQGDQRPIGAVSNFAE